jgi:prolyl 4-hydroxylase
LAAASRIDLGDRAPCISGRHPRNGISYLRGALSPEECDAMVEASAARIRRIRRWSTRPAASSCRIPGAPARARTSSAPRTRVVAAVEQRLARLSGLPEVNGEGLEICTTGSAASTATSTYFDPATPGCAMQLKHGGQRLLTIILYLNDVAGGGGTIFPELDSSSCWRRAPP